MDLGPLLGLPIKQETLDDQLDGATPPAPLRSQRSSMSESGAGECGAEAGAGKGDGGGGGAGAGPDSLASPPTSRASWLSVRCVFCSQQLAHTDGVPKLLECLHSACEPCLALKLDERVAAERDLFGGGTSGSERAVTCSACRLQSLPANMIEQRFVSESRATDAGAANGAAAAAGDSHCSSCEDTEPATSYCVECAELICDSCVLAHQRLKITKDHTIRAKDELRAQHVPDMLCKEHPQERLALFCETCDRLTCRDCQLQHHRDHRYQFSSEMAAQARQAIGALLSEVSYKRVLLGSAMKVIRERQALITDKKKALVHEITQCVVKLTHAVNTRGKQLVLRLGEVCDAKQRTLQDKKEALEQLSAVTDHCIHFCGAALQHGSDTALLHAKRHVTRHLQRVKSRRADIPNPEIPVRIGLALDQLPELLRLLAALGAIVVDGKVDGAPPSAAQGPYHPPPAPAPPPPPGVLQHAAASHQCLTLARYQSYGQARSPVGAPPPPYSSAVMSQLQQQQQQVAQQVARQARALAPLASHTPLRHPHVTSTTHPHLAHDMSLRGLLTPAAAAAAARHQQLARHNQQVMQHAYHQVMGAYASGAYGPSSAPQSRPRAGPRTPSPAPAPAAASGPAHHYAAPLAPAAKWHIPQHGVSNGAFESPAPSGGQTDFKIQLGRAATVTSTNPKTPSPSLAAALSSEAAVSLDKLCAESVQDLMATIAKLDSNGVQVLPESAPAASPHVHSSTDEPLDKAAPGAGAAEAGGDPNEDWCAVCMDGGELMCCDKCPKVFHQYCHIPTIDKLPDESETWQCLLCVNFAELGEEEPAAAAGGGVSQRQQKLMERITLELYCQYETSLAFREALPQGEGGGGAGAGSEGRAARDVCLDAVRMRLQPGHPQRYRHVAHFVADVRLLFRTVAACNAAESQAGRDARRLEAFFDAQLAKWLPDYLYWRPADADCAPAPGPAAKRPRLSND